MANIKEVTIVTGANRGIGKAIALKFAKEGHNLAIFGRDEKLLKEAADEIKSNGVEVLYYSGDVADEEFVKKSVDDVLEKFGGVDNLINNAGTGIFKEFVDSTLNEFKRQIDTNLYGIYNFTKAVIYHMIKKESGSIINISSLAGKNGFAGGTMYGASKHAVMGFTKSLMHEVRKYNIKTAAVCPGSVATDLIRNSAMQPKDESKVMLPEDVADVVWEMVKLPVRANVSELDIRPTNPKK